MESSIIKKPELVVAIDFGTTYTGYAWQWRNDFLRNRSNVQLNSNWGSGALQLHKTSTCILLTETERDGDGGVYKIHSFGQMAENMYKSHMEDLEECDINEQWYFVKGFKYRFLSQRGMFDKDVLVHDSIGRNVPLIDVVTKFIEALKDHFLDNLKQNGQIVEMDKVLWVVTVPAIWSDEAKAFMSTAAEMSGIKKQNLLLALEPEAAAINCIHLPEEQRADMSELGTPGQIILIADVGGSSVDLTAVKVLEDGFLDIIFLDQYPVGGQNVNNAFFQVLHDCFEGNAWIRIFGRVTPTEMMDMEDDFEQKKVKIGVNDGRAENIKLKIPFVVRRGIENETIRLKRSSDGDEKLKLKNDKLTFNSKFIQNILIKETCLAICNSMKRSLNLRILQKCKLIALVGGFAESPIAVQHIREIVMEFFPEIKVVVPTCPFQAVLKGAVLYGHDQMILRSRISRFTYGVATNSLFNEKVHDGKKKWLNAEDNKFYCKDILSVHVEKGQSVILQEQLELHKYHPMYKDQKYVKFSIYASTRVPKKAAGSKESGNVMYTTDEGCRKIGEVNMQFSDTNGGSAESENVMYTPDDGCQNVGEADMQSQDTSGDRNLFVRMVYGGTELSVIVKDEISGSEVCLQVEQDRSKDGVSDASLSSDYESLNTGEEFGRSIKQEMEPSRRGKDDAGVECVSSDYGESLSTGDDFDRSMLQDMGPNNLRKDGASDASLSSDYESLNTGEDFGRSIKQEMEPNRRGKDDAGVECVSSDYGESLSTGDDFDRSMLQDMGPNNLRKGMKENNICESFFKSTELLSARTSKDIRSKYANLRVFRQPHCLIKNDENGKLSIETEVMEELSQIDDALNVIAIAGPYRTGKSYLLNRLAKVKRGFPLGNTTTAATKGIWVWCLEHPEREDEVMMLLDTEGIGDVEKGDEENDNNILCLTTLLSGTFVYNMIGVLDEKSLKNLSLVAQISKKIALSNTLPQDDLKFIPEIGFFFPSFVLCLRDFFLKMDSDETPDTYFEKCLKVKKGEGKKDIKYNTIRISVLENFRNRKCFTFDRPAGRDDLARLEDLKESKLGKDFVTDTELFVEHVYSCEPKTLFDGSRLNGRMFASLAKQHTESIRFGMVPCIDDALTIMSRQENKIALEKAVDLFKQQIESLSLPLPDDFEDRYRQAQRDALEAFQKLAVLDDDQEFQKLAKGEMDTIKETAVKKNRAYLEGVCSKELQSLYDKLIKPKVTTGDYFKSGGYQLYREDFATIKENAKKRLPRVDSNLIQMCALELEGRYRNQDEVILEKAAMTEAVIQAQMQEQHTKLKLEMCKLMQRLEATRKEEVEKQERYNKTLSVQMEKEKHTLKEKYEKMVRDSHQEKEDLESKLKEQADLILKLRVEKRQTTVPTSQSKKPPLRKTVLKTMLSLLPIIGPIATGFYEHFS